MSGNTKLSVFVSASEVASHCGPTPEFLAEILNFVGAIGSYAGRQWQQAMAAALADTGEAALRSMVARLDAIDATSTEGR